MEYEQVVDGNEVVSSESVDEVVGSVSDSSSSSDVGKPRKVWVKKRGTSEGVVVAISKNAYDEIRAKLEKYKDMGFKVPVSWAISKAVMTYCRSGLMDEEFKFFE